MKRPGRLTRKTELGRGGALSRHSELQRGNPPRRTVRLRQVSRKRRAGSASRQVEVAAAFTRDGWVLVAGEWTGGRCIPKERGMPGACFGKITPHRLRKGSNLGTYTRDNVVASCALHNDMIEDEPDLAKHLGLVVT